MTKSLRAVSYLERVVYYCKYKLNNIRNCTQKYQTNNTDLKNSKIILPSRLICYFNDSFSILKKYSYSLI